MDFQKYTHIVWDFNGTLLDDVDIGIDSVNVLLKRRKLPIIADRKMYHVFFGFPIIDYYSRLGFDFEKESYDLIAVEWVKEYNSRRKNAGLCTGARQLLEKLKGLGVTQLIISATELNMLKEQLSELGIKDFFSEIAGLDNIKAGSKRHIAEAWKQQHPDASVLFIGDTDHDKEVADAIQADCILIANGHQSYDYLMKCGVPVYNSLEDILY